MNSDELRFEWDDDKAEANYRKHGVGFPIARRVFDDSFAVERPDHFSAVHEEDRFVITGMVRGQLVTVVYTERSDCIRLISARLASKREHDDYYRQNSQE
jgi:uncharacterized protein